MRAKDRIFSFLSIFFLIIPAINAQTQKKPLSEIYKKGKISFIQELVISDSSLPEGEFLSQISSFKHKYIPVKVTKEDKEQFFAGMVVSSPGGGQQQGAPDYIVKNTEFPKTKPAFDDIKCDPEGNIWVHTHCKDRE
jgi:hypothetical protein